MYVLSSVLFILSCSTLLALSGLTVRPTTSLGTYESNQHLSYLTYLISSCEGHEVAQSRVS